MNKPIGQRLEVWNEGVSSMYKQEYANFGSGGEVGSSLRVPAIPRPNREETKAASKYTSVEGVYS